MPRGDRTGPAGQGPRTGRGLGFCAGNDRPGFMQAGPGWRGGGRFRAPRKGFGFAQTTQSQPTKEQEKDMLKQELEAIKQEQQEIEKRLKELK